MARFDRQFDLVKCDMATPITVVGAGGIGSFTVLTLAKMGFSDISVFDFDRVEEHNLPNQFYRIEDIGRQKVEALYDIVNSFADVEIMSVARRIELADLKTWTPRVLVSAVDNMATRKQLYEAFNEVPGIKWFVDGRMGADQAEVYVVDAADELMNALYAKNLWSDAETASVPCTSRATMYNVLAIASLIANSIRLALMDEPVRPAVVLDNKNISMYYIK